MKSKPIRATDPLDINVRLYRQLGKLLDDMEAADRDDTMTFPQRISCLIAIGRIQKMFADLRKADLNVNAGTQVARYAAAFAQNAASGRKADFGTVVEFSAERDDDDDDEDDGDDAA